MTSTTAKPPQKHTHSCGCFPPPPLLFVFTMTLPVMHYALIPLCHWHWAPPRLPPLLSRSCRLAPPSTTGSLSQLPAEPVGTQTAEGREEIFRPEKKTAAKIKDHKEAIQLQSRIITALVWRHLLQTQCAITSTVPKQTDRRTFSPVFCVGQTPCNRRKDMYTAVCSDTEKQTNLVTIIAKFEEMEEHHLNYF